MSFVPSLKTKELIEEINRLVQSNKSDEFTLKRLEHEIKKLASTDPDKYMLLGTIAALKSDIADVHKCYKRALMMNPHDLIIKANYAVALFNNGVFWEAADQMQAVYEVSPDYLYFAFLYQLFAGRFRKAKVLLGRLSPEMQTENFIKSSAEVIEFAEEKQITDEEIEKVVKILMSVLHENQAAQYLAYIQEYICIFNEGDSKWIHYGIVLENTTQEDDDTFVDKMVEFDFQLADKLAKADLSKTTDYYFSPNFVIN